MISERGKTTTSSLIITHATQSDSGKYECDPSVSYPQSVNVHVIKIGKNNFEVTIYKKKNIFGALGIKKGKNEMFFFVLICSCTDFIFGEGSWLKETFTNRIFNFSHQRVIIS